jgi:valyl-tRNA synthetase
MDEGLSRAVKEAFVRLYRKGLIYKGRYIINWCPRCHTALSDLEVSYEEKKGAVVHPLPRLVGGEGSSWRPRGRRRCWATPPSREPKDERFAGMIGETLRLPLMDRPIPVVGDPMVDREFGTGAVKITPAHDANDFEVAKRHGLPSVRVIDESGVMTSDAGAWAGMDRFACRESVVARLKEEGLLVREEPYLHNIGHCYRCRTVVEPAESMQWFVRTKPLAEPAIAAVRNSETRIIPPSGRRPTSSGWRTSVTGASPGRSGGAQDPGVPLRGVREDRRRRREAGQMPLLRLERAQAGDGRPRHLVLLGPWPFSTLGLAGEDARPGAILPHFHLVTGFDILFFWVARMMMMGMNAPEGPLPRRRDPAPRARREGREDEQDAGERHRSPGSHRAVRDGRLPFTLVALAAQGRDIRMSGRPRRGIPELHEQALPGGPVRHHALSTGRPPASSRATCRWWTGGSFRGSSG